MQGLPDLSVHENHLGSHVNVGSEVVPPGIKSGVCPQNLHFNTFQVIHDPTFKSLGIEVPSHGDG